VAFFVFEATASGGGSSLLKSMFFLALLLGIVKNRTGFRRMDPSWAREIRDQCVSAGVKFNFMQYAAVDPRPLGRELDGREWKELPDEDPQMNLFLT
jgi:protein gp37